MSKMTKVDRVCEYLLYIISIVAMVLVFNSQCSNKAEARDYTYEAYCDSIFFNDKDYYYDVLVETDEYQEYLEEHGQWWEDECPAYLEMKEHNDFKKELLDAEENCIKRAEYLMLINGIQDEEYNRCKFVVDSLVATQL